MKPSPYLLVVFSGLASQKWMCPSTTKYFSPSFSYKTVVLSPKGAGESILSSKMGPLFASFTPRPCKREYIAAHGVKQDTSVGFFNIARKTTPPSRGAMKVE